MTGIAAEPTAAPASGDTGNPDTSEGGHTPTGVQATPTDKGGDTNGGDKSSSDPFASFSEEHRALAKSKGWKSPEDAFNAYREAQTLISRGEHKKQSEQKGDEGGKAAEPTAADYTFTKPENAEAIGYSDEFAGWFAKRAEHHKLDPKTARALHDDFLEFAGASMEAQAAAEGASITERLQAAERDLTNEWGKPGEAKFDRNRELAARAVRELGLDLAELGAVVKNADGVPMVTNAGLFKALAKIGQGMFAEDSMFGNPAPTGQNPFDPKTLDLGLQGRIWKSDPDKAKALIRALPAPEQAQYSYLLNK